MITALVILLVFLVIVIGLPFLNAHAPIVLTIIGGYLIICYFCIPLITRTWRYLFPPTHLPQYVVSRDGWPSDPINIAIVAQDKEHLRTAMQRAGWTEADPITIKSVLREGVAILFRRHYPSAPFSPLYLFGRPHDIGFQMQTGPHPSPRHRHHVRFWHLQTAPSDHLQYNGFWHRTFHTLLRRDKQIWIGAATHDIAPIAFRMQSLQITHKIDADTEKERDFVIASLQHANVVRRQRRIKAGDPLSFRGQTFGVKITVDGAIEVIEVS